MLLLASGLPEYGHFSEFCPGNPGGQGVGVTVRPMRGHELGFLSGEVKKEAWYPGGANLAISPPLSIRCGLAWRELVGVGSFPMAQD